MAAQVSLEPLRITIENLDAMLPELRRLGLTLLERRDELAVFSHGRTGRKFIIGRIECPYCGERLELFVVRQPAIGHYTVEQFDSDFINHMHLKHGDRFTKEWIRVIREPYQPGSWHIVKRYVCQRCGFKTRRYADALAHIILVHRFPP